MSYALTCMSFMLAAADRAVFERRCHLDIAKTKVAGASRAERRVLLAGTAAVLEVGSHAHHFIPFD